MEILQKVPQPPWFLVGTTPESFAFSTAKPPGLAATGGLGAGYACARAEAQAGIEPARTSLAREGEAMKSLTKSLWGLALCVALWGAPVALADDGGNGGSWLQILVETIEEIILGTPPEDLTTLGDPVPVPNPELGELYPPGG